MNKQRRAELAEAANLIAQALDILLTVGTNERAAFYGLENAGLGGTTRAMTMDETADRVFEISMDMEELLASAQDIQHGR